MFLELATYNTHSVLRFCLPQSNVLAMGRVKLLNLIEKIRSNEPMNKFWVIKAGYSSAAAVTKIYAKDLSLIKRFFDKFENEINKFLAGTLTKEEVAKIKAENTMTKKSDIFDFNNIRTKEEEECVKFDVPFSVPIQKLVDVMKPLIKELIEEELSSKFTDLAYSLSHSKKKSKKPTEDYL